jgi:hypothetical protein
MEQGQRNRLLTKMDLRKVMKEAVSEFEQRRRNCKQCQNPMLKGIHTCLEKAKKKEPEDLTKLTDEALKQRIFYSNDSRSGESSGPLIDELWRRYLVFQSEVTILRDELIHIADTSS